MWWGLFARLFAPPPPVPPPPADMLGAATLPSAASGGAVAASATPAVLLSSPPPPPPAAPSAPDGGHPYLITATLLDQLRWDDPDIYAIYLGPAAHNHGITTRVRVAAFLAQVGHESGGGRHRREIASGAAYEGRRDLGNTQPGDGRRFRGRGLIQITGRANTTRARDALKPGMEMEAFCEWLEGHGGASVSAAWWWSQHGCNALADKGDFLALTKRINGGINGLGDRQARWAAAKRALGV